MAQAVEVNTLTVVRDGLERVTGVLRAAEDLAYHIAVLEHAATPENWQKARDLADRILDG